MIKISRLFSIGETSKLKDISIKTLRYYHEVGILIPKFIDKHSNYRYYSAEQFIYIDVIKSCRELGTSIKELQEIFKNCDTAELLLFLDRKRIDALSNIEKMNNIVNNIDSLKSSVENFKSTLQNSEINICTFDTRYIAKLPCKEVGNLAEMFYYSKLENFTKKHKLPSTIQTGIIYNINSHFEKEPLYVFNELAYSTAPIDISRIDILPSGRYLTLSYSRENENSQFEKLQKYLSENNIFPSNIIEVDLLHDFFNINSYSCQIQIYLDNINTKNF